MKSLSGVQPACLSLTEHKKRRFEKSTGGIKKNGDWNFQALKIIQKYNRSVTKCSKWLLPVYAALLPK